MNTEERKFLHDLANPLASAIFILEMVLDDAEGEQLEQLQKVNESLKKMKSLVQERQIIVRKNVGV